MSKLYNLPNLVKPFNVKDINCYEGGQESSKPSIETKPAQFFVSITDSVADKTFDEIIKSYDNGHVIFGIKDGKYVYELSEKPQTSIVFKRVDIVSGTAIEKTITIDSQNVISSKQKYLDIDTPQHTTLIVTVVKEGIGGYVADYTSDEIRNHVNGGGICLLRYDDVETGEQVYTFENFRNNIAYFRRAVIETNTVKRLNIGVLFDGKISYEEIIYDPTNNAMELIHYTIDNDTVNQLDATTIISDYSNYEGRIIEFLTNGEAPNKTVSYGFVFGDKTGNKYLTVLNMDGTLTQYNKSGFEKHNFETRNYINEPMYDMDSLTVDIAGDAPFMASVQKAKNKPENTSDFGIAAVLAYSVSKQLQLYRDITTGKTYTRTVTGEPNKHAFSVWNTVAGNTVVDASMSDTSENAVQNKVVKKYIDDMFQGLEARVAALEQKP